MTPLSSSMMLTRAWGMALTKEECKRARGAAHLSGLGYAGPSQHLSLGSSCEPGGGPMTSCHDVPVTGLTMVIVTDDDNSFGADDSVHIYMKIPVHSDLEDTAFSSKQDENLMFGDVCAELCRPCI